MAQNDIHNYFVGHKFSSADYAIYAYGCFEVPLIAMLSESVTSVLIPRMNKLQLAGDHDEMIRLTARASQKLALFYFPIYVFLMITAKTFIITLFTQEYAASADIFVINITMLPFMVIITDPILRSYKELGRLFLLTRILILTALIAVLYFGLATFSLTMMITVAIGAILIEKFVAETMIIKKLGLGWRHLPLLKNVAKTAVLSVAAGIVTYFVYENIHVDLLNLGERFAESAFSTTKLSILNFVGGGLVLLICGLVYLPIYLLGASLWGVIEEDEKRSVKDIMRKVIPRRQTPPVAETQS